MPEKSLRKSCDVGLRCEKSGCFLRSSDAKWLRFGLPLRFGLRCEHLRCQIASDVGRAMRTTKSRPDLDLKRRISGPNQVEIRSTSGPNQVWGGGCSEGAGAGEVGPTDSVAPQKVSTLVCVNPVVSRGRRVLVVH